MADNVKYEPLPRWGHVSVAIGDKVYMWGGCIEDLSEESRKQLASQVEVFDTETELWSQKASTGSPPNGLYNCAYTALGNKLYVYGGWDSSSTHSTLHCLDTVSLKWEEIKPSASSESPMKMSGCALVSHGNDNLVLFGGCGIPVQGVPGVSYSRIKTDESAGEDKGDSEDDTVKRWTNQLKVYNTSNGLWTSPSVTGEGPPPCVDFSFSKVTKDKALVYGGFQPETGAVSDAYILNMENWHWHKLGCDTELATSTLWPRGRDGHACCVLSEEPNPQVLISGGWDQHNTLLHDAWIFDINSSSWRKLCTLSSVVGPRIWHTVVSLARSLRHRQLMFFGGCPSVPIDISGPSEELSLDKIAATIMVELGCIEPLLLSGSHSSLTDVCSAVDESVPGKGEWVMLDAVKHNQLGHPMRRMKEKVIFAEYRVNRAEASVRDIVQKMGKMSRRQPTTSDPLPMTTSIDNHHVPSWVIPREDVELTETEIGRGKWGIVKEAKFNGENVAARCLANVILSEENRTKFMACMEMASKLHQHPNLLPFFGAVIEDKPIIIMERMTTNLKAVVEKGKSPLLFYQAVGVALDVAKGLEFLHSLKPDPVIHGNLTSTSILLEKGRGNTWKAKISKFTTAKFFQQLLSTNQVTYQSSASSKDSTKSPLRHSAGGDRFRGSTPRSSPLTPMRRDRETSPLGSDTPRLTRRTSSTTALDSLDPLNFTMERDVYCYGLILVEICTGTLPMEVSLSFLIESISWQDMSGLIKECVSYEPSSRPSMEIVVSILTEISDAVSVRGTGRP